MPHARVLVVDDMATNLAVAKGMMSPYGMTVDGVTSGKKAIEILRHGEPRYDAVFMDHMMPEMDGIEAVRILRNEIDGEYARNIPIIALTANAMVGTDRMFLENGFQAFLSKPINAFALDSVLNQWVRPEARINAAPDAMGVPSAAK
jgi:CheY-like chemotaxis protein